MGPLIFFGIIVLGLHMSPRVRALYTLPKEPGEQLFSFKEVLAGFAIYLGVLFLFAPVLVYLFWRTALNEGELAFLPVILLSLVLLFFFLLCRPEGKATKLWKSSHGGKAFLTGVALWVIAFPVVTFIGEAGDLFVTRILNYPPYEQNAVTFLKSTMGEPHLFFAATLTVLVLAPLTEEWLFRGMLLNYLKNRFGQAPGLFISAAIFAFFHMARAQGIGNIPLFCALFPLGCYLGLLYLREGTLLAPLGLHMTFNAGTTLYLLVS